MMRRYLKNLLAAVAVAAILPLLGLVGGLLVLLAAIRGRSVADTVDRIENFINKL